MKIVEEDIEVLDMIIEKVLEKESINIRHLPIIKPKLVAEIDMQSFVETSYDYYLYF